MLVGWCGLGIAPAEFDEWPGVKVFWWEFFGFDVVEEVVAEVACPLAWESGVVEEVT